MRVTFHGGFGEKGRTSLSLASAGTAIILDVGINTSDGTAAAPGPDYYPAIAPHALAAAQAIVVSHAHEDHIGALGWCLANGFAGRILMTAETRAEMAACLEVYGEPAHRALADRADITLITPGEPVRIGPFTIRSGRSGHTVGGLWLHVEDGRRSVAYSADVVPGSPVLAMDPLPRADCLAIDASYGDDDVPPSERVAAIAAWTAARPRALMPTPVSGKPLEILMAVPGPVALHESMRGPVLDQIAQAGWLHPGAAAALAARVAAAPDWHDGDPWPDGCLLAHDGMGMGGPSQALIARADAEGVPILLTGHLPKGSPAQRLHAAGRADWIRLPTHPVLRENLALAAAVAPSVLVGHSCDGPALAALAARMPASFRPVRTGDNLDL